MYMHFFPITVEKRVNRRRRDTSSFCVLVGRSGVSSLTLFNTKNALYACTHIENAHGTVMVNKSMYIF